MMNGKRPYKKEEGAGKKPYKKDESSGKRPYKKREEEAGKKPYRKEEGADKKPFKRREEAAGKKPYRNDDGAEKKPFKKREERSDKKPFTRRDDVVGKKPYWKEEGADKKPYKKREESTDKKPYARREDIGGKKPYRNEDGAERKPFKKREEPTEKKPFTKSEGRSEKKTVSNPDELRLNRFIANAGICSRRDADMLIAEGKIKVNGTVVTEMGYKVQLSDKVQYQGKDLHPETMQYVLLNKPTDFITTMDDPQGRNTVMSLVSKACTERIFPVGRLDRNTTGLLLFTNDGELAKKLTHPSHQIKKIYQVTLDKPLTKEHFEEILKGVPLEDGVAHVTELAILSEDNMSLGIEIHIGKNRIVRRIFEHFGYNVDKLDRVMFGPLTKQNLPRGKWRHLGPKEIMQLKKVK
jgi:23S rRNA pseudouridine2605 synthase